MKCEIDIPTPRFKVGDVIRKPNVNNNGAHILRIINIRYEGTWYWTANGPVTPGWSASAAYYYLQVCEGSVYDDKTATPRTDVGAAALHKIAGVDAIARKETI